MPNSFSDINFIDIDQDHMLGRVHSMIAGSVVDGPGIRHVIFLQGCQFKCLYCHNRDTWDMNAGQLYKVSELAEEVLTYTSFLNREKGGVTVTGGEPMLQAEFVGLLFQKLQSMGLHTCLDTNGYAPRHIYGPVLDKLLRHTSLVMLDIKQMDSEKHKRLTGIDNDIVLKFADHLHLVNQHARVRYVVVPGYSDNLDDVRRLGEFVANRANFELIELLPYHRMGKKKWEEYNDTYQLDDVEPPSKNQMEEIQSVLQTEFGLDTLL